MRGPVRLRAKITAAFEVRKPAGLLAGRGYSLAIDSVRPSAVAVTFSFWVKGYQHAALIREIVNKAALDFIGGKK